MSSKECTWCHNDGQGNSYYSNGTNSTMKIIFVASSIACVIGFISLTCCCMICFIRRLTNPRRIVVAEPTATPTAATVNTSTTSSPPHGIDLEVLSSSTIFTYSSSSQERLDCAVCLSEMKDGEKARRLSWCGHCFHAECVDEWLRSHSTCPLCRSSAKTKLPELHV